MKGRATLNALFEKKTLVAPEGAVYKMKDGVVLVNDGSDDEFRPSTISINNFLNVEFAIRNEYHLTFQEALKAMLEGKIVICQTDDSYVWRITENGLEIGIAYTPQWYSIFTINEREQKAKWRVME